MQIQDISRDVSAYRQYGTAADRYFTTPTTGTLTTATTYANVLHAFPFVMSRAGVADLLAVNCTAGGAGSLVRVGLYRNVDDLFPYPGKIAEGCDSGDLDCSSAGVKTASVSYKMGEGLYWLIINANNALATLRAMSISNAINTVFGVNAPIGTTFAWGLTVPQTYGTLPTTYPSRTLATYLAAGNITPLPFIRFSLHGA